jgi:hypothetical protein
MQEEAKKDAEDMKIKRIKMKLKWKCLLSQTIWTRTQQRAFEAFANSFVSNFCDFESLKDDLNCIALRSVLPFCL